VSALNGEIKVESHVGKGTSFKVTLPATQALAEQSDADTMFQRRGADQGFF